MSKTDHIIANATRMPRGRSKRNRLILPTLIVLLLGFVFFTQPEVRASLQSWISQLTG